MVRKVFIFPLSNIFFFQSQSQQCGNIIFHSFDPVTVRLSLDSSNIQHEKLMLQLVKPYIEGFSVKKEPMEVEVDQSQSTKRKQNKLEKKSLKKIKN